VRTGFSRSYFVSANSWKRLFKNRTNNRRVARGGLTRCDGSHSPPQPPAAGLAVPAIGSGKDDQRQWRPRLHPNLARLYRRKVQELEIALRDPLCRDEELEIFRSLVDHIEAMSPR
jgi:hypothetical protein